MKYHVVYKEKEQDYYSTGESYEVGTPEEAIELWRSNHPDTVFMALYVMQD